MDIWSTVTTSWISHYEKCIKRILMETSSGNWKNVTFEAVRYVIFLWIDDQRFSGDVGRCLLLIHSVPLSRTEIKIHGLSVFPNTDDLTQTDKISPSSWYPSGSSKRRAESCPWSEQNSWRSYWIEQKYVTLPASSDILNHLLGGRGVSTRGIVLGLLFLPLKFLKDPFQVVGVVVGVVPYGRQRSWSRTMTRQIMVSPSLV